MMSQWSKTAKFHSEFKWKALPANIREEDSPKYLQNLQMVLSMLYNDDKIYEK